MSKTIIWDFNGTIIDDVDLGVEILNQLYQDHQMNRTMDKQGYKEIFDFPVMEYYKNAGFDLNEQTFRCISKEYMAYYQEGFKKLRVSEEVVGLLKKCQNKGYKNVILSASQHDVLISQVENLQIASYFDEVLGIEDIYATSKKDIAIQWAKKQNGPLIFIGDTAHDYEVAQAINATCYLVSDGHFSRERLLKLTEHVYPCVKEVEKCLE